MKPRVECVIDRCKPSHSMVCFTDVYSPKISRQLILFGMAAVDLWTSLEAEPNILIFAGGNVTPAMIAELARKIVEQQVSHELWFYLMLLCLIFLAAFLVSLVFGRTTDTSSLLNPVRKR